MRGLAHVVSMVLAVVAAGAIILAGSAALGWAARITGTVSALTVLTVVVTCILADLPLRAAVHEYLQATRTEDGE